jgi:hypothetical protein
VCVCRCDATVACMKMAPYRSEDLPDYVRGGYRVLFGVTLDGRIEIVGNSAE